MEHRVSKETADSHKGVVIFDQPNQYDHRGMVLRATCELENELGEFLLAFLKSQNPLLPESRVRKDLFTENGLLGSLGKMTRIANYIGLITDDEAHDLRCISRLRNMYAHGRHRDQFYRDPESATQVRSLKLFVNSKDVFAGFDEQGVFLACQEHLVSQMRSRSTTLKSANDVG